MARFKASPTFAAHPTLSFITEPINNTYFHIGYEGIRYESGWGDSNVVSLLTGTRPLIFVLGGSTTLGHGLASDETWPYFLNTILANGGRQPAPIALNFGAQAYVQTLELAKLIYLLKSGYRPNTVIFLDGWNDLFMARSNMRLADQVIFHGFASGHGEIVFTPGAIIGKPNTLALFLQSLPVYRLLQEMKRVPHSIDSIRPARDAFADGFDFREADYLHFHWAEFGELHRERYKQLIVENYRGNLKLLQALASEYGFRVLVFYQPIGLLDSSNSFVSPLARQAPGYRYLAELNDTVRKAISSGHLQMIDISDALNSLNEVRYIDVAHYTPAANRELARVIATHLRP